MMVFEQALLGLMNPRWGKAFPAEWQVLGKELGLDALELRALHEMINFFHFPPRPQGFFAASKSLLLLLELIKQTGWQEEMLDNWHELIKKTHEQIVQRSTNLTSFDDVTSEDILGLCTKYPIYATWIRMNGEQSALNNSIILPIGFLVLAAYNHQGYRQKLTEYGLCLRKAISYPDSNKTSFELMSAADNGALLRELCKIMAEFEERTGSKQVVINGVAFSKLPDYISGSYSPKSPPSYRGKRGKGGIIGRFPLVATHMHFGTAPIEEKSEVLESYSAVGYVHKNLVSVLKSKNKFFEAIDPHDFETHLNVSVSIQSLQKVKPRPGRQQPPSSNELAPLKKKLNASMIAQAITKENQLLMTKERVLDTYTLNVFVFELIKLAESGIDHAKMYAAVLACMLFRGLSLSDAILLKIGNSKIKLPNTLTIGNDFTLSFWHMPANLANININKNTYETSESSVTEFDIPLNAWLHYVIKQALFDREKYQNHVEWHKENQNSFFKDRLGYFGVEANFTNFYKLFYKRVRSTYPGIDLNESLISNFLSRQASIDYDIVYSAYFCGKASMHSRIPLHYARINVTDVAQKYKEFWLKHISLLPTIQCEASLDHDYIAIEAIGAWPQDESSGSNQKPCFIGSAAYTRHDHFEVIVALLKAQMSSAVEKRDWLTYHRWYAAYSLLVFTVGSGYRGVHDVLPSIRLLSPGSEFVAISDKDDSDLYHTRLVYLAPTVQDQLKNYSAHVFWFSRWMISHSPEIYSRMITMLHDAEYVTNYRKTQSRIKFDESKFPVFFDIDVKTGELQQLSIVRLMHMISQVTNLAIPSNVGRHLLRTEFLKHNIPAEVIDAFMGHQVYGMEVHHPFSAFDYSSLPAYLETPIKDLLTQLQLAPIRSDLSRAFK